MRRCCCFCLFNPFVCFCSTCWPTPWAIDWPTPWAIYWSTPFKGWSTLDLDVIVYVADDRPASQIVPQILRYWRHVQDIVPVDHVTPVFGHQPLDLDEPVRLQDPVVFPDRRMRHAGERLQCSDGGERASLLVVHQRDVDRVQSIARRFDVGQPPPDHGLVYDDERVLPTVYDLDLFLSGRCHFDLTFISYLTSSPIPQPRGQSLRSHSVISRIRG